MGDLAVSAGPLWEMARGGRPRVGIMWAPVQIMSDASSLDQLQLEVGSPSYHW